MNVNHTPKAHGGGGVSDDFVLAGFYAGVRALRTGLAGPELDLPITRGS